jgi:hypothetical protein
MTPYPFMSPMYGKGDSSDSFASVECRRKTAGGVPTLTGETVSGDYSRSGIRLTTMALNMQRRAIIQKKGVCMMTTILTALLRAATRHAALFRELQKLHLNHDEPRGACPGCRLELAMIRQLRNAR